MEIMNETLPTKINRIESEVSDLKQAIELVKVPPSVKVDESVYPALGEVRRLLAEAKSQEDANQRLIMLEDQLAGRKAELDRFKQALKTKQERVDSLKVQQGEAFQQFKRLESELLKLLQVAMGYGQAIAAEETDLVQHCKPGVVFAANTKTINRLMDASIADGRVVLSVKESGLFQFVPDGFGGFSPVIPDCTNLIDSQEVA